MADFIIKSAAGTGNKTLIQGQDQSGSNYAIQVGDAGATTLTNATITAGTFPAGHVVQTTARAGNVNNQTVTSSPTSGTWYATVVTGSITPIYSNSSIIVNAKWVTRITESTGDCGYGFRFYKSATGITDGYRDGVANYDGAGSVHSSFYRDPLQQTSYVNAYNISWIDDTSEVADTAVTYTLYHSTYNVDTAIASGATYEGRWDMFFQEIKR